MNSGPTGWPYVSLGQRPRNWIKTITKPQRGGPTMILINETIG